MNDTATNHGTEGKAMAATIARDLRRTVDGREVAYDATALIATDAGVHYIISCWHDESAESIIERASNFYGLDVVCLAVESVECQTSYALKYLK